MRPGEASPAAVACYGASGGKHAATGHEVEVEVELLMQDVAEAMPSPAAPVGWREDEGDATFTGSACCRRKHSNASTAARSAAEAVASGQKEGSKIERNRSVPANKSWPWAILGLRIHWCRPSCVLLPARGRTRGSEFAIFGSSQ